MNRHSSLKDDLVRFSRIIAMLFNRATMYHIDHPYVTQSLDDFYPAIQQIFKSIPSLVFILHLEKFFLDEEPVDPRINFQRIAAHFKKTGLQSISFESDLSQSEMKAFMEIFTALETYPNAEAMKRAMAVKGVRAIKINHVVFRKVSQDDEVIAQDALKKLTPDISEDDPLRAKKLFVDLVLENLLAEELRETITIENLLKNPVALSEKMTETDIKNSGSSESQGRSPGIVLQHQIEILGDQVKRNLLSDEGTDLQDVAAALFAMKKRLMEGMQAQKSLNISYPNEETILDRVNEITDSVILKIVKDEYAGGKTSIERLAQIVRRLVPEPAELKRLLPGIRATLLDEGMVLADYLRLVEELGKELQSDELAQILERSSEELGIDGESLIEEVKINPTQVAELIYLASEIRKGTGDEQALSEMLVDYVEHLGTNLAMDIAQDNQAEDEQHFRKIMTSFESSIVGQLKQMDIKDDLLERLEERFSKRIDEILQKVKLDWIHSQSGPIKVEARREMSVLELLEQSVGEGDELGEILADVRAKVQANRMNENDFGEIYAEITKQQQRRTEEADRKFPKGVLQPEVLTLVMEKHIAMAKRYGSTFSALSFSLIKATQKKTETSQTMSYAECMAAVLKTITSVVRGADFVGLLGRNRIVVLLPMTVGNKASLALKRCVTRLHSRPINASGTLLYIRVAGVATTYDPALAPNATTFVNALTNELVQMERRIKNVQAYF
jgi:hypothetical protein